MQIMDFANDDNFGTSWNSNPTVKAPWYEIDFDKDKAFNMITIVENSPNIKKYRLEYYINGVWKPIVTGDNGNQVKIHRFERIWASRIRILIDQFDNTPSIAEFGIYNERK